MSREAGVVWCGVCVWCQHNRKETHPNTSHLLSYTSPDKTAPETQNVSFKKYWMCSLVCIFEWWWWGYYTPSGAIYTPVPATLKLLISFFSFSLVDPHFLANPRRDKVNNTVQIVPSRNNTPKSHILIDERFMVNKKFSLLRSLKERQRYELN